MSAQQSTRTMGSVRRPQILAQAARLFQAQGYHATSMDQVAGALNLNKATIYHHFPGGKSELLYGINSAALDDLLKRIEDADLDGDPIAALEALIEAMLEVQIARPHEVVVYYEEGRWLRSLLPRNQHRKIRAKEAAFRSSVLEVIEGGIDNGIFQAKDPTLASFALVTLVGASYRLLAGEGDRHASDLTTAYTDLALGGLLARP